MRRLAKLFTGLITTAIYVFVVSFVSIHVFSTTSPADLTAKHELKSPITVGLFFHTNPSETSVYVHYVNTPSCFGKKQMDGFLSDTSAAPYSVSRFSQYNQRSKATLLLFFQNIILFPSHYFW